MKQLLHKFKFYIFRHLLEDRPPRGNYQPVSYIYIVIYKWGLGLLGVVICLASRKSGEAKSLKFHH